MRRLKIQKNVFATQQCVLGLKVMADIVGWNKVLSRMMKLR